MLIQHPDVRPLRLASPSKHHDLAAPGAYPLGLRWPGILETLKRSCSTRACQALDSMPVAFLKLAPYLTPSPAPPSFAPRRT